MMRSRKNTHRLWGVKVRSFNEIDLIFAPIDIGQPSSGVRLAPDVFTENQLIETLEKRGWISHSKWVTQRAVGDSAKHSLEEFSRISEIIASITAHSRERDRFCLTIGGDHAVALGSIGGLLKSNSKLGVVWVDAHGDVNTPSTSLTGNFHGMPLAGLLGIDDDNYWLNNFDWLDKHLDPKRLVFIGVRDLDPEEKRFIEERKIKIVGMDEINNKGMNQIMDEVVDHLKTQGCNEFHLSYDVDAIDPSFFPATGTPVANGISANDAIHLVESLRLTGSLVSMDLVEFNPSLAKTPVDLNRSITLSLDLVLTAVGHPGKKAGIHSKLLDCLNFFKLTKKFLSQNQ